MAPTFTPPPALTLYQASRELTHTLAPQEGQPGLSDMSSAYGTVDVLEVAARGASQQIAHIGTYVKNQAKQGEIVRSVEFDNVDVADCLHRASHCSAAATLKLARAASDLSNLGDALTPLATKGGPLRPVSGEARAPEVRAEQTHAYIVHMWLAGELPAARAGIRDLPPDEIHSLTKTLLALTRALNEEGERRDE